MSRMAMEWNSRKSTLCVWATLVITTFALSVLFVLILLYSGTNHSLKPQGSSDRLPHSEKLTEEECIPVCDSVDCILRSKVLLDYLQPALNPCDNFNKFTCGSLAENFPEGGGFWSTRLNKQIRIKFKNILENLEPIPDSASAKMKIVYDSCIILGSETESVPTLLQILEKFGIEDWPHLTPEFEFGNITLAKVIANLLLHDEYGFVTLSRNYKPEQSELLKVTSSAEIVNPTIFPSSQARKLESDRILQYFNLDSETVTKIQEDREAMQREIENLKLESEKISSGLIRVDSNVDCSGETENEWADLCEVINLFLDIAKVNGGVSNKEVSIETGDVHYVQNIFPMLRNFSDRAVANYIAVEVFLNHMNDLSLYFRLAHHNGFNEGLKLFDMASPIDRWQTCVDWISKGMTYSLMYEYGKKEFTLDMFDELTNITDELIQEAAELYTLQEWVPEDLRRVKVEELKNYKLISPSMKHFPTDATVNEFYDEFKPKDASFLNNVMEFRRFKTVEKMRGKIDIKLLEMNIFRCDASGGGGEMDIGLGLLQPPYFSTRTRRIFNLVSLGFMIAHEIGHSMFDYRDGQLDDFRRKMLCIIHQVSQYQFELIGENVNGMNNMGEDLCDNVAVTITDKIIGKYLSEGIESILPGFPFSAKQLLLINRALIFCSASSKRMEEFFSKYSMHSPDDVRVQQIARNSKIFPEVFDCPVGSSMNPADKCLVLA